MAITVRVVIKDFNKDKLQEEILAASLPIEGISWAGFIRSGELLHTPFPLQAHNSATLTDEQIRMNQDTTDLNALLATDIAVYRNHLATWDAKTTANKLVAGKEMFTIIGKVLRIFIRRNRDGGGGDP